MTAAPQFSVFINARVALPHEWQWLLPLISVLMRRWRNRETAAQLSVNQPSLWHDHTHAGWQLTAAAEQWGGGRVSSPAAVLGGRFSLLGSRSPHHRSSLIKPSLPVRLITAGGSTCWKGEALDVRMRPREPCQCSKDSLMKDSSKTLCSNRDALNNKAGFLIKRSKYLISTH